VKETAIESVETTLGPDLKRTGDKVWHIDLSQLRIFFGLSILARSIGEEINEKINSSPGDVSFLYKINPTINSELLDMHITHIQIYARAGLFRDWLIFREDFESDLRLVLGSFQRQSLARKIHPEFYGDSLPDQTSVALLFPFHGMAFAKKVPYQIIMERVSCGQDVSEFFLRITIDEQEKSILNLARIEHEIVSDFATRSYIAGASKISESLNISIISAVKQGEDFFEEENSHFSRIFEQLEKTPLGKLSHIHFFWEEQFASHLLSTDPRETLPIFKKLFLLLEDRTVTTLLRKGETIVADLGKGTAYVDLSRLDRIINFSFNKKRTLFDSQFYLNRMPAVKEVAMQREHSLDFSKVNVFLIHHITSEIIAMIECLRHLKVRSLDVAFVKYGGTIPPVYLDILLDIPTENFFMAGLEFKVTKDKRPYYGVSPLYSDFSRYSALKEKLDQEKYGFFDAMRILSTHLLLQKLLHFHGTKELVLLIEDGGYVSPFLNQRALEGRTLGEVCTEFFVPCSENLTEISFRDFFAERIIGTVEHTRNGFDRLSKTAGPGNELVLPAFSIAISEEKAKEESKEVAQSILNAIENTLHGLGKVISKRKFLLLGSKGNIGGFLLQYLQAGRLHESNQRVLKVDLKYGKGTNGIKEIDNHFSIAELSKDDWAEIDFLLGVTGDSVLKQKDWENWILCAKSESLYLASGSTKTAEFTDLLQWLNELLRTEKKQIKEHPLELKVERIIDPQTQMDLGAKYLFHWTEGKASKSKTLFLMSDGSPINFVFYGVPTESMDPIIAQLITVSLGLTDRFNSGKLPQGGLYAVDHEIDAWGRSI
jgi:hypothetical protein